jgi:hypothetical protein
VCHQSVGLIAREIEAAGVPTLSMTSAWSITAAARAPRAAFVDHPLGHTTGRAGDPAGQRAIVEAGLRGFETIGEPGTIIDLGCDWGEDGWRADPLRTGDRGSAADGSGRDGSGADGAGDSRTARHETPQYQTPEDRALAEARVGPEAACRACVGFDG